MVAALKKQRRLERKRVNDFVDRVAAHDPVPCNGCTACCRDHQAVTWHPGDDASLFTAIGRVGDDWQPMLPQHNGDCGYLIDDKCSIYERRPRICRAFDCRRQAAQFTPEQQIEGIMRNVFSAAVFRAGRERADTLKLLPEEEGLYANVALHLLARAGRKI